MGYVVMFTSAIYMLSPVWLQNVFVSLRAYARAFLRENKSTIHLLAEISALEKDENALSTFHQERLFHTLESAISSVPFYKSVDGLNANSIESFPYITKQDIVSNSSAFQSTDRAGVVIKGSTSGTTGTPLSIPQNIDSVVREQAFISRSLQWAGFEPGDKRAWIRGDMIVPIKQNRPPYWRYSVFENMILLSSFHMTSASLPDYIEAMADYGVDVIQAYPSSIVTLAKYLEINDQFYSGKLKSILTSSESLSSEDKALVERRFACQVFDWYGLFERVAAIASCEYGRYHVLTDYSHVEFLDVGDGKYELVGSNFNNSLYPLIRYRTGDHVVLSKETACECERVYPIVEKIEGRVGDFLVAEGGQKVHILNHIPKGVAGLLASQFVQGSPAEIEAVVVVDDSLFDKEQEQQLVANIQLRLGSSMMVRISRVNALPRTKNGKVRQAICTIDA